MIIIQLLCLLLVLYALKKQSKQIQILSSIREQREREWGEIIKRIIGTERCRDIIQMDPSAFVNLCVLLLRDCGGLQLKQTATIEEQVAKFLYIFFNESFFTLLGTM